jgi:hypothetical protein
VGDEKSGFDERLRENLGLRGKLCM